MQANNWLLPLNNGVPQTVTACDRLADPDEPDGPHERCLSRPRIQHSETKGFEAVYVDLEHFRSDGRIDAGSRQDDRHLFGLRRGGRLSRCRWRPRASLFVAGRHRDRDPMEPQSRRAPRRCRMSPARSTPINCRGSSSRKTSRSAPRSAMRRWAKPSSTAQL